MERVRRFVRLRRGRLGELKGIVVVALLLCKTRARRGVR